MELLKAINKKLMNRYAKWIAEEDMLRIGLHINLLKIDNVNKSNKEIING